MGQGLFQVFFFSWLTWKTKANGWISVTASLSFVFFVVDAFTEQKNDREGTKVVGR